MWSNVLFFCCFILSFTLITGMPTVAGDLCLPGHSLLTLICFVFIMIKSFCNSIYKEGAESHSAEWTDHVAVWQRFLLW